MFSSPSNVKVEIPSLFLEGCIKCISSRHPRWSQWVCLVRGWQIWHAFHLIWVADRQSTCFGEIDFISHANNSETIWMGGEQTVGRLNGATRVTGDTCNGRPTRKQHKTNKLVIRPLHLVRPYTSVPFLNKRPLTALCTQWLYAKVWKY